VTLAFLINFALVVIGKAALVALIAYAVCRAVHRRARTELIAAQVAAMAAANDARTAADACRDATAEARDA